MRGNRTESLREKNLPPRGPPRTSENFREVQWRVSHTREPLGGFRRFSETLSEEDFPLDQRLSVLLPLIMLSLHLLEFLVGEVNPH